MVVKMMKWRPWPPLLSRKFQVKLVVKKMEGVSSDPVLADPDKAYRRAVEIRWKGPKITLGSFRRSVKRNFTKEEKIVDPNGVVLWDEEFHTICTFSGYKENVFHPWEVGFTVLNGLQPGLKNKVPVIGTASLNLAEFASASEDKDFDLNIPLTVSFGGATEPHPSLHISLSLVELRSTQEPADSTQSQSQTSENSSGEKDELSALKAGLRKVKTFKDYMSIKRGKKSSREDVHDHEISESRSDEGDSSNPFDSDSLYESEGEPYEAKEADPNSRKSFSYGKLAYTNCAGACLYEDSVYYSNRKSDAGCSPNDDLSDSVSESCLVQNSKRSILPWKKRKLNFRSPKAKGEPLLKKDNCEEGGDDIDFDRRQLDSDESLAAGVQKAGEDACANQSPISEFGDDGFVVGNWEPRDIISRDGHMKLRTEVFFASIDQRSEQAAGESACTALVAVIADWFQNNRDLMPLRSQLDSLIREGSLEWRNLCDNETYMARFPDKHFDLETVLEADTRRLTVVPEKSFVGFFHPEETEDNGRLDFLHGAMSFDSMWDEISRESELGTEFPSHNEPRLYIVSWNDHFFVLKVDSDSYYIIDTLGERLFEGCNQAYILKFDRNTSIHKLPTSEPNPTADQRTDSEGLTENSTTEPKSIDEVISEGKECCKEYIKSFLAALPIRELQADIKKGLLSSTPLHHRLQIEFHYTRLQPREARGLESIQVSIPVSPMSAAGVGNEITEAGNVSVI